MKHKTKRLLAIFLSLCITATAATTAVAMPVSAAETNTNSVQTASSTTGWQTVNGKTYYYNSNGVKTTGWKTIDGKRYYFGSNGVMRTGWQKISGYRYYFSSNGVLDEDVRDRSDVRGISHIVVSLSECTVTVIGKGTDGVGDIPMVKFICSPGLPETATPTGTYYSNKYGRWVPLMGPSWGQYGIHVVQGIFFHSIACTYQNVHNVPAYAYSQLGKPASHGCIRMLVGDVKWLYDNIGSNTKTVITYDTSKSVISYFSKPSVPPLQTTNGMNWDPTDPVAQEMFNAVGTVTGLKASATTTNSISLTWNKVSNADGYYVYRRNAEDTKWIKIKKTTALSFTDNDLTAGTTYKYAVKAYKVTDGTYYYGKYPTLSTATNPEKLTGLTAAKVTANSVNLTWNKVSGATGYWVYCREYGSSNWTKVGTTSNLSYIVKNLDEYTEYQFAAKAYKTVSGKNYAGTYPIINATTLPSVGALTNLKATSTTNSITLTWDNVANADGYHVYRRNAEDTKWSMIATLSDLSYTDETRTDGTQYKYAVRAYRIVDGKEYLGKYPTIITATKPAKLTNLKAAKVTSSAVTLEWDAVNGATGYWVYYREYGSSKWTKVGTTSNLSYNVKNLDEYKKYQFAAKAYKTVDGKNYAGTYPIIDATTAPSVGTLKNLNATSTINSITLTWDNVANADGYHVYRRNAEDTKWSMIATLSNVSYTDEALTDGTQYKYAVRAYMIVDGKEYLGKYPTIITATKPAKLTGLTVTNVTGNTATLEWDAVNGATGYWVYCRTANSSKWTKVGTTSELTFTCKNLSGSTEYQFAVKAYKTVDGKNYAGTYPIVSATTDEGPAAVTYKTTTELNYRSGPGTSYPVKGTLAKGTSVLVSSDYAKNADGYTWYQININGTNYYAAKDYLVKV